MTLALLLDAPGRFFAHFGLADAGQPHHRHQEVLLQGLEDLGQQAVGAQRSGSAGVMQKTKAGDYILKLAYPEASGVTVEPHWSILRPEQRLDENAMTSDDAADILRRTAGQLGATLQPAGDSAFELSIRGLSTKVRRILEWELDDDSHVRSVHFYCVVGYVIDPSACRALLHGNCGGLGTSPFYCSLLEINQSLFLQWETRQLVGRSIDEEQFSDILTRLIANPIFLAPASTLHGVKLFT